MPVSDTQTPNTAAFVSYLAEKRPLIESRLADACPHAAAADGTCADDLERYLYRPLERFCASGGKRTRPALCLLGAEAVGDSAESALSAAVAVETFQSAALIHDDIADEGELRRGVPCLHVSDGIGIATNVGDLALVVSTQAILDDEALGADVRLRLIDELMGMERRTLEGQALDLGWVRDGRWDITVDDYLYMASHKTAYYSAAVPLVMGAICAGASEGQIEALRSFGMAAGLAFQLQDDLLNLVGVGDSVGLAIELENRYKGLRAPHKIKFGVSGCTRECAEAQGKDFRSDITEGKRTMAAVWAVGHLPEKSADELVELLSAKTTDAARLARAVELMEESGAIERVRGRARELVDEAKGHLASADFSPSARRTLTSMADFFVERLG